MRTSFLYYLCKPCLCEWLSRISGRAVWTIVVFILMALTFVCKVVEVLKKVRLSCERCRWWGCENFECREILRVFVAVTDR